ncbi:MAG TPA: O-antigen ligase family protein [Armatimonadota bacterium]|jgi:hypothetical protein
MDNRERLAAQQARRALERLAVLVLFLTPLLMNPLGQSLCGRIKIAAMWAAAGGAGFLFSRLRKAALPSRLLWPGVFWMLATLVTVMAAVSRVSSAWAALNLLPGAVLALAFAEVARKAGARRRLMLALVASAGISSAYAIAQHYALDLLQGGAANRAYAAAGTVGSPVYLGAFLALALPFALAISRMRRSPRWLTPAIAAIVVALVLTYARAAWVAAAAGLIVTIYAAGRGSSRPLNPSLGGIAMIIMMALPIVWTRSHSAAFALSAPLGAFLIWWLASLPGFSAARRALAVGLAVAALAVFADTHLPGSAARTERRATAETQAASARKTLWGVASGLFGQRPFLGYGPDGYRIAASTIAHDSVNMPDALLLPHQNAQSEWYSAAVEGGALGLVAWALLVVLIAGLASDRAREEAGLLARKGRPVPTPGGSPTAMRRADTAAAVFGAIAAFVIQGSFTPRAPTTTLCLALCWGLTAALEPVVRRRWTVPAHATRIAGYGWGAAAIVAALSTLGADTASGFGAHLRAQGRPGAAVPYYRAASLIDPSEVGYRRALGETALEAAAAKSGMEVMGPAEDAAEAYSANLAAEPRNGIWRAGLAQALCYLNTREAVTQARQAVREAPVSSTTWMALSRAYRASGNAYGEKYTLRAAIESEPLDPSAYVRLAGIFRDENRPDLSDRLLGWAADSYPDHPELAPWRGKGLTR